MEPINLIETFLDFKDQKNIDRVTMMSVLEDVFRSVLKREYGSDENFAVIINIDKGDFEIWRNRKVVDDSKALITEGDDKFDPNREITLSDALKIDADFAVGDEVTDEVKMRDFQRRTILTLRQSLASRITELEKDHVYNKYRDKIGDIVTGEVYQLWGSRREILVLDDEGNELVLPKEQQIPTDKFRKGDTIRAIVFKVELRNNNPLIILSRTSPVFLHKLLELEVPEIFDGLITVKKVVRQPGERAKIAVESYDERVDPVGACVGMKGSRIHGIVRELRNENIDVVNFSSNTQLYIQRALNPAKIHSMKIDEETKHVDVFLKPEEVSMAIGKGGLNIKLAGQLTGYNIDVYRQNAQIDDEDVKLDDFSQANREVYNDYIDDWVIDRLKAIGCDYAKDVLKMKRDELLRRSDLEEETVDNILKILKSEFDKDKLD
ncbi:MAG: transcription termination factor NusA [Bacteroidales bacterium]|jgi:N utilization substance protein A|nr:transcription termination factor NusA [Bacteroidales bacterium]